MTARLATLVLACAVLGCGATALETVSAAGAPCVGPCLGAPPTVAAAVTPPASVGPTASVGSFSVRPGEEHDLTLPAVVTLAGQVQVDGTLVDATLLAIAKEPSVTGLAIRSQATAKSKDGFSLELLSGVTYVLTIDLGLLDRPLHNMELTETTSQSGIVISLPAPESYPTIEGRVLREVVAGKTKSLVPVAGVLVGGRGAGDAGECTSAVTDSHGTYALRCPSATASYDVVVGPTSDGPVVPVFTALDGRHARGRTPTAKIAAVAPELTPDIVIPASIAETQVTLQVFTATGVPVAGVPIAVSSSFESDPAVLAAFKNPVARMTANTDDSGLCTVRLIAGHYRVVASPHPSLTAAVAVTTWDVTAEPTKKIVLGDKMTLSGVVLGPTGAPVLQARVAATLELVDPATSTRSRREYTAETDAKGQFTAHVDPGTISVVVTPPDGSGLPLWRNDAVALDASAGKTTLTCALASPLPVNGRVLSSTGAPVPGAGVDLYAPDTGRLLGHGLSDKDGRYRVLLPGNNDQ